MIKLGFYWQGYHQHRLLLDGKIIAESANLARYYLSLQQIDAIKIRRTLIFSREISRKEITVFYRQLSTLLNAQITLAQAIHILCQTPNTTITPLLKNLHAHLLSGTRFSHAMRKLSTCFDPLSCHLLYIAEETGTLDLMLTRIANHQETLAVLKNKIKQALFYPAIVSITVVVITIVMLMFVIPRFEEVFTTLGGQLPYLTQRVLTLSHHMPTALAGVLVIGCVSTSLIYYLRRHHGVQIDRYLLTFPGLSTLSKKIILARFTRTLMTILQAGMPLSEALKQLITLESNQFFQHCITDLHQAISQGQQLHIAMQQAAFFPVLMVQMVQVGEESGALEKMLEKIAEFFENDIDSTINQFTHLLEPLIIIILGVLIGGLVIAMYLPIFKLGNVM